MSNYKQILTRYWFEFNSTKPLPSGIAFGCGITAYDINDAITILKQRVFNGGEIPELKEVKENIDIQTLDQGHIISNIKDPTLRGVWFPIGYE